jgi:hypothetical protein
MVCLIRGFNFMTAEMPDNDDRLKNRRVDPTITLRVAEVTAIIGTL